MITIKTLENNNVEIKIDKGTPHTTMLLGIEMLVEALMNESSLKLSIDDLLSDIKRIYERDNKKNK